MFLRIWLLSIAPPLPIMPKCDLNFKNAIHFCRSSAVPHHEVFFISCEHFLVFSFCRTFLLHSVFHLDCPKNKFSLVLCSPRVVVFDAQRQGVD